MVMKTPYDPTQSKSFVKVFNKLATQALENSYGLMTEDLVDSVNDALSYLDEPSDLVWLIEYMRQYFELHQVHFEWEVEEVV
jgi:hypothetical protein